MAIKGKSKSRGGKGRSMSAPKPVIAERKPPFLKRKPVRLTLYGVLGLAILLGGLRIWQNSSRSGSLRTYDRSLTRAQALLTTHLAPDSITSLQTNIQGFTEGKVPAKQFKDLAGVWEKDFRSAKETVAKLKPPRPLVDAQALIVQGIEGYVGMARLYQVAGTQKENADALRALAAAEKDAAAKKKLEDSVKKADDQVQVLTLQAREWRDRSDAIYGLGTTRVNDLKTEWGIDAPATSTQGDFPVGLSGWWSRLPAALLR